MEELIIPTEGAFVPSKMFWYLIDFTWLDEYWSYIMVEEVMGSLEVTDSNGISHRVERSEPDYARWTL